MWTQHSQQRQNDVPACGRGERSARTLHPPSGRWCFFTYGRREGKHALTLRGNRKRAGDSMDLLLSRGAAINSVNNDRCSALHVAVCLQYVQCVRVLLRYHCDVNLQNSNGNTALHHLLYRAITNWDVALDTIDALCACERVDFTLRNKFGFNILHVAAHRGNAHVMERLVTYAHHLVDVQMEDGNAALHLAALKGHRKVAAILLSQNGGRAKVDLRNNLGQTPLCLAALHGHWPLVKLLVHHKIADFDEKYMCTICMERRRNVAFLCGHCACEHCAAQLNTCHICRKTITKKINLC